MRNLSTAAQVFVLELTMPEQSGSYGKCDFRPFLAMTHSFYFRGSQLQSLTLLSMNLCSGNTTVADRALLQMVFLTFKEKVRTQECETFFLAVTKLAITLFAFFVVLSSLSESFHPYYAPRSLSLLTLYVRCSLDYTDYGNMKCTNCRSRAALQSIKCTSRNDIHLQSEQRCQHT